MYKTNNFSTTKIDPALQLDDLSCHDSTVKNVHCKLLLKHGCRRDGHFSMVSLPIVHLGAKTPIWKHLLKVAGLISCLHTKEVVFKEKSGESPPILHPSKFNSSPLKKGCLEVGTHKPFLLGKTPLFSGGKTRCSFQAGQFLQQIKTICQPKGAKSRSTFCAVMYGTARTKHRRALR